MYANEVKTRDKWKLTAIYIYIYKITATYIWTMEGYSNIVAYNVGKSFYYPLKIFRRDWLAPIPLLILHDQLALTKIGRCEQYTIDDIFDRKRDCVGSRPSINIVSLQARPSSWLRCEWNEKKKEKKMEFRAIQRRNSKNTQNTLLDGFYLPLRSKLQKKNKQTKTTDAIYIRKPWQEIGQS